jgi:hypothetical protein
MCLSGTQPKKEPVSQFRSHEVAFYFVNDTNYFNIL